MSAQAPPQTTPTDGAVPAAQTPDSLAGTAADLLWKADSYGPTIHGSGALKLAMSAVAPLVAIAHGYYTLTEDNAKALIGELSLAPQSGAAKQVRSAVADGADALFMPWFGASVIGGAARRRAMWPERGEEKLAYTSVQLRPERPRTNESGKVVKYEILAGHKTPLGFHPAVPESWMSQSPTMLITEGALKADSAISAHLRHVGIDDAVLAEHCDGDTSAARVRLREVMDSVPDEQRVLIMALVGVGTWHKHPDWTSLNLSGVDTWIAFDGDVVTNPDVWREAQSLRRKISYEKGSPYLLMLSGRGDEKLGIDDFLATHGDWSDLSAALTCQMPPAPARPTRYRKGDMRIDAERRITERNEPVENDFGQTSESWVEAYRFAGRVKTIKQMRAADPEEMRTGRIKSEVDPALVNAVTEIEVSWLGSNDEDVTTTVLGTGSTLADPPEQWHRRGAIVPADLTAHPDWPPKPEWLKAVKENRPEDIDRVHAWEQMGWVPTETGQPVFIAGRDVLGVQGIIEHTSSGTPGIGEAQLAGANMFGLHPAADRDEAKAAFEKVISTYLKVWTRPEHAAVVLATAFRPAVPIAPKTAILFSGSSGAGKTYSISCALHPWQARPGQFLNKTLGAVSDTFAATEYAISRVPIWGVDDLAPSADGRKADGDEAKVTDLIRAIHNDAPKRRMNADMTTRVVNSSRVMAMFSAENPLSSISAMTRVIHVRVTDGYLSPDRATTTALDEMVAGGYEVNHVLAACIQHVQDKAAFHGWEKVVDEYSGVLNQLKEEAAVLMGDAGDSARAARNAADIALGLHVLSETAIDLGVDPEIVETIESLIPGLNRVAAEGYAAKKDHNAGINLVRAVANALAAGKAHITSSTNPGELPIGAKVDLEGLTSSYLNSQLGWSMPSRPEDAARARGDSIGYLIYRDEDPVVLLSPEVAFNVAAKAHPGLVQSGMKSTPSWETAWAQTGLLADYWARRRTGSNHLGIVVRANKLTGVPVRLETLLKVANGGLGED